jgi:hypothetical protein
MVSLAGLLIENYGITERIKGGGIEGVLEVAASCIPAGFTPQ